MAYLKSNAAQADFASPLAGRAGETVTVPFEYTLTAALAASDVVGLVRLPAGHVVVDYFGAYPDLDSDGSPAITHTIGLYADDDGTTAVDADAYVTSSTVGQAAGNERMAASEGIAIAPSTSEQIVAMTVGTGPATGATSGTIRGWVQYRPQQSGK